MKSVGLLILCLITVPMGLVAVASDFYVDPVNGSESGDGSQEKPWDTLEGVISRGLVESRHWEALPYTEGAKLKLVNPSAPVRGGDTIRLLSGHHGAVVIQGAYNLETVTVMAEPGHTPTISSMLVRSASHWTFKSITFSPSFPEGSTLASGNQAAIIDIDGHGWHGPSHDIEISDSRIFTTEDTSEWTKEDWDQKARNGIFSDGSRTRLINNNIFNVSFAITINFPAKTSLVENNRINMFSGDGMRGLADRSVFKGNWITNSLLVNGNHSDGFQSWANKAGGASEVVGIRVIENVFLVWVGPRHEFSVGMQGVGCFDGMFRDFVVEGNIVSSDNWHGITFSGAQNLRVSGNIVVDPYPERPGPAWIMVGSHKDGRASTGITVTGNVAHSYKLEAEGLEQSDNQTISKASEVFADITSGNLTRAE